MHGAGLWTDKTSTHALCYCIIVTHSVIAFTEPARNYSGMKHNPICLGVLAAFLLATPAWAGDATSKIISVSSDSITVGKKHAKTYKITPTTAVAVNGAKVKAEMLKPGMEATVVATAETATSIDAHDKPPKKN